MSQQLTIIAHLIARADKIEATRDFLLNLIPATHAEPGCIDYLLHQDNDNPAEFTYYENWSNREEWDKHMELPHLLEFAERKDELFEIDPHIRYMSMIGGRD